MRQSDVKNTNMTISQPDSITPKVIRDTMIKPLTRRGIQSTATDSTKQTTLTDSTQQENIPTQSQLDNKINDTITKSTTKQTKQIDTVSQPQKKIVRQTEISAPRTTVTKKQNTVKKEPQKTEIVNVNKDTAQIVTIDSLEIERVKKDTIDTHNQEKFATIESGLKDGNIRQVTHAENWISGILILGFVLFASVRIIFNKYLNHLFQAVFNLTTAARMFRERIYKVMHAAFRLDIIFILMWTLSLYMINDNYQLITSKLDGYIQFSLIGIASILYFGFRAFIYFLTGLIFNRSTEIKEYLFDNSLMARISGLVLLPLNTILAFANHPNINIHLITSLSIVFIITTTLIRGFIVMRRKHISIFYLILYLCTLEILPLLLIYKIIENLKIG